MSFDKAPDHGDAPFLGSSRDFIEKYFEREKGPRIWGSVKKKKKKKQGDKLSFEFDKAPDHGKAPIIGLGMSAHRRKSAKQSKQ